MNQGVLEAGRQARAAGLNVRKKWTLGPNPCPVCEAAAAEGDIGLDKDFGEDAGDSPPAHPNCECNLDLFVADEEEEAKMQDDDSDNDHLNANGGNDRHVIDTLADLIAEAGSDEGKISRQDALRWLLRTSRGSALVARMARHRKHQTNKGTTMTRTDQLYAIVKQAAGLQGLCQKIIKRGTSDVGEAELTGMITAAAKAEYPDLDDARAFTKLFAGPNGEMLRRAVMIAKAMPEPEKVGGDDATDVNDPEKALRQLREMVAELRRHASNLSESAAWDRVMAQHKSLAKLAFS